jgi:hypothetical protein
VDGYDIATAVPFAENGAYLPVSFKRMSSARVDL